MTSTLLADRRDHVIDQLSSGFAGEAFDVEELDRRLALAHSAQTPAELDALVTDLVPTVGTSGSLALVPAKKLRVIMGSVERVGPWVAPQHMSTRVLWGNLVLDLREARLAPGVTTIDVHCTMGNVEIIVPPGVAVDVDASSLLANIEERIEPTAATAGALVRVTGRVKLGNLEVMTMQHGETHRDQRERRRWERRSRRAQRRMMRHGCRRGLPAPGEWL